jgi:hypothetical protein
VNVEHLRVGWCIAAAVSSKMVAGYGYGGIFTPRRFQNSALMAVAERETKTDIYVVPRYVECLKPLRSRIPANRVLTTLNIAFSVTYYMELRNALTIYCIYHFMLAKVKLVVWTL